MSDIPAANLPPTPPIEIPLAPPPAPETLERTQRITVRIWCIFIFSMCAAMMSVALYLKPSPDGTGTHEQLGLPPCGMLAATGYPCPTCGCTTAVSNFAHGHLIRSFLTQPFGFAVALLAVSLLPLTFFGAFSGRWVGPSMFWLNWHWQYWVYGSIGILLLGWAYKVVIVRMHIAV